MNKRKVYVETDPESEAKKPRTTALKDSPIYFEDLPGPSYVYLPGYRLPSTSDSITDGGPQITGGTDHPLREQHRTSTSSTIDAHVTPIKFNQSQHSSPDDVTDPLFNAQNPEVVHKTAPVEIVRIDLPPGKYMCFNMSGELHYFNLNKIEEYTKDKSVEDHLYNMLCGIWDRCDKSVKPSFLLDISATVKGGAKAPLSADDLSKYLKAVRRLVMLEYSLRYNTEQLNNFLSILKLDNISIRVYVCTMPDERIKRPIANKIGKRFAKQKITRNEVAEIMKSELDARRRIKEVSDRLDKCPFV